MVNNFYAVKIPAGKVVLDGNITITGDHPRFVLFAHGSGSSRNSPRNRYVARVLNRAGIATLLFDLLTREEEQIDLQTAELRFDISLLAERLLQASEWLMAQHASDGAEIGYFGASTGAAAALMAAASAPQNVRAVVSRGGRPDLAGHALTEVQAATLLIAGGNDKQVIELNRSAMARLRCEKRIVIIPGATHLFEEPGALEQVAALASEWFQLHLGSGRKQDVA